MLSPRRKAALIAFAVFMALSILAIHASPMSNRALEARLQDAADAALERLRADDWAEVEMNGQIAIVRGLAPTRAERDAALAAVGSASWAGGVVAGGVTRLVDETRLAGELADFGLRVQVAGGRMTLTGYAPDQEAAERLERDARTRFSGRVEADFTLAPGGAPEGWAAASALGLSAVTSLEAGALVIRRDRMAVTGLAPDEAAAEAARTAIAAAPEAFTAGALVRVAGQNFDTEIADPRLCELMVEGALGPRPVAFQPGRAALTADARTALRRAGDAFNACRDGVLIIAVRAQTADGAGEALALSRGEAVVAAMADAGVSTDRFLAEAAPVQAPDAIRFTVAPRPAALDATEG